MSIRNNNGKTKRLYIEMRVLFAYALSEFFFLFYQNHFCGNSLGTLGLRLVKILLAPMQFKSKAY